MDVIELLKVERIKLIHEEDSLKKSKSEMIDEMDTKIDDIEKKINSINEAISIVKYYIDKHTENDEQVVCPSCLGSGKLTRANFNTNCTETVECFTCHGKGYILKSKDR